MSDDEAAETTPETLEQLLERIDMAGKQQRHVSLETVMSAVGRRSFGPILLLAGLVIIAPVIGDIPGVPTLMGLLVALTAVQLLAGRRHIWLPRWLLGRSVQQERFAKVLKWLRPVARFLDRFTRPRLQWLTRRAGFYLVVVTALAIALATPVIETVPFSANLAGAAIIIFGLSLIARDGLLMLLALGFTVGGLGLIIASLT